MCHNIPAIELMIAAGARFRHGLLRQTPLHFVFQPFTKQGKELARAGGYGTDETALATTKALMRASNAAKEIDSADQTSLPCASPA